MGKSWKRRWLRQKVANAIVDSQDETSETPIVEEIAIVEEIEAPIAKKTPRKRTTSKTKGKK